MNDPVSTSKSHIDGLKTNAKLLIAKQPEQQHRARYLSEGSRGAIKDRSGTSHCTISVSITKPIKYVFFLFLADRLLPSHQS